MAKITLEDKIKAAEEKAKKERAKVNALKKKQKAQAQAVQLKVLAEIFPDAPEDEKGFREYFKQLLKYADLGVQFEERQKQQRQQQAGQHQK